jgi:hypothetical protein
MDVTVEQAVTSDDTSGLANACGPKTAWRFDFGLVFV